MAIGLGIAVLVVIGVAVWLNIRYRLTAPANPLGIGQTETPASFKKELPYFGNGFSIDYLPDENTYLVNIYEEPVEKKKDEARRFLEKAGAQIPPSEISFFLGPDISEHTGP